MNAIARFGTVTEDGLFMPFIKIPGFEQRVHVRGREREREKERETRWKKQASLSRHGFNETIVFEDIVQERTLLSGSRLYI